VSQLRDCLRKYKLEQLAELFEAHDVDFDVLRGLNDADLEKLGLSLGNRRRLLNALAERDDAPIKPKLEAPAGAERRQVTCASAAS
jgi:hypothetical protein